MTHPLHHLRRAADAHQAIVDAVVETSEQLAADAEAEREKRAGEQTDTPTTPEPASGG